jgi:dipeptidyl aminopeptidase/acylaminoacyl peptidase
MFHLAFILAGSIGLTPSDVHRLRSVREVAIRPDGGAILFTELDASGRGQPESKLMIFERTTGAVRPFRGSGLSGSSPRWSPNGERVAPRRPRGSSSVTSRTLGRKERLVAKVEGTNQRFPHREFIAWSPDSRSVALIHDPGSGDR